MEQVKEEGVSVAGDNAASVVRVVIDEAEEECYGCTNTDKSLGYRWNDKWFCCHGCWYPYYTQNILPALEQARRVKLGKSK